MSPDFIGIGFQRCATSWLNQILSSHPDIGKPRSGLHFFDKNYHRGLAWYEEQITRYGGDRSVRGEFSTTYSYPEHARDVARRIQQAYPAVKLIFSVRNPGDRAYSEYRRGVHRGEMEDVEFAEALRRYPALIDRGRYGGVLDEFYQRFSAKQIHVIRFDDVEVDPNRVVRGVYAFLGVTPHFLPASTNEQVGKTYTARSVGSELTLRRLQRFGRWAKSVPGLGALLRAVPHHDLVHRLRQLNTTKKPREELDPLRSAILEALSADIERTISLTGLNLSEWRSKGEKKTRIVTE